MKYSVPKAQTRTLVTCTTKAAENAIKEAARTKDEELYHQIDVMDLIAKVIEKASDFDKVVEFTSASILSGQQAVSMKTLTKLYNRTS